MQTVVLLDHERPVRDSIAADFKYHGFNVLAFDKGQDLIDVIDDLSASAYLIAQSLPDSSGLEVLRNIRVKDRAVPIFIITTYGTTELVVKAMESGADDYLGKHVSVHELIARIKRAIVRRKELEGEANLQPDVLELRKEARILLKGAACVALTRKELEIFEELFKRRGQVVTREDLYQKTDLSSRILDVHMFGLRKKLGELDERIQTLRGVGYRLL